MRLSDVARRDAARGRGIVGKAAPCALGDTEAVLEGAGRVPLDDADLIELGARAGDLPFLG
jgi:hypothetical protein